MTMVAYFGELGVALSDLLLTVDGKGRWPFLPSVGYPSREIRSLDFHVTRLVRKVARITHGGRTSLFLIAGTVRQVDRFLHDVELLKSGKLAPAEHHPRMFPDQLESVLQSAAEHARDRGHFDIGLVGLHGEKTIAIPTLDITVPYFGRVMLLGSGARAFGEWLEVIGADYARKFDHDDETMKAYRISHYMTMQLLSADRMWPSRTLSVGVGGFYEVYLDFKGQLEPDNMTWVRVIAELGTRESDGIRLQALWYHEYQGNNLVVMSALDLRLTVNGPALLPVELLRVDVFCPYGIQKLSPVPPLASELFARVPRAKFQSLTLKEGPLGRNLLTAMDKRNGLIHIERQKDGLKLNWAAERFAELRAAALTSII